MKNTAFNRLRCRLLSHVTFGKMKRHYRKKYKESLARAEKYDAEKEMNALKSEVAQCVNPLKEDVAQCKDKLENIQNACRKFEYFYRVLFYAPAVAQHHREVFLPYKGVYKNKDIVICASGPTLNFYNRNLLKNAVHIGVNQAVLNKNVGCDYMFSIDFGGIQGKEKEILSTKCEKFFGIMRIPFLSDDNVMHVQFPVRFLQESGAKTFYVTDSNFFNPEISEFPLSSHGSSVFPAIEFALYTGPKRIYLAGADCGGGYFNSDKRYLNSHTIVDQYKYYKKEIERFYPDIEIVSVNPVGLKGLFHDVYTESYLNEHPEIDRNDVELLREGV